MGKAIEAIEQIGGRIGILACLLIGYMYMQLNTLQDQVDKLETKTEAISEIKADLSSIKGQLDLIIRLNKANSLIDNK